jgi:WD40 repeat protein
VKRLAITPDGATLIAAEETGFIGHWEIATGKQLKGFLIKGRSSATFSNDCKLIASSPNSEGLIILSDLSTGEEHRRIRIEGNLGNVLAFSPNGRILVSAPLFRINTRNPNYDFSIRFWDVSNGTSLGQLDSQSDGTVSLAFSADGRQLISGMSDGTALTWDVAGIVQRANGNGK